MKFLVIGGPDGSPAAAGALKSRFPGAEVSVEPSEGWTLARIAVFQPDILVLAPSEAAPAAELLEKLREADPFTREVPRLVVVPAGASAARPALLDAGADALVDASAGPAEVGAAAAALLARAGLRSRALVEQAEEALLVHDMEGKVRDVNRRACELFGYSREELLGLGLRDLQERLWLDRARDAWQRIRRGQPVTRLDRFVRKDESRFAAEVRLGRLDLGGEPLFLALLREEEERVQAARAREESERTFAAIFRSSPVANLLTSMPDGAVIDVNEVFLRDMGFSRDEVVGRTVREMGLFQSERDLGELLDSMKEEGGVYGRECRFRRKDGRVLTCLLSVVDIVLAGRRCRLSTVLDISGRKRHEEALRESEARFRAAFEDVDLSICLLGLDGKFLRVNDATCRFLGRRREELEQLHVAEVTHPDDAGLSPAYWGRAVAGEIEHWSLLKRYVRSDGTVLWGQVSGSLVRDAAGAPAYFISHLQDVSELQRAREDLEELSSDLERRVGERTAELESANRELESFSYSVSHDLRAPLRAIDGFSKRLSDRFGPSLDPEGTRLFGVIRKNTLRMAELIDDLLAFSRASRLEIRRSLVRSAELVDSVLIEVAPDPEERARIAFRVGPLPDAWGDPKLLRQVWVNLLSNAVKFSTQSDPPSVDVTGGVEAGRTVFRVRDNGVGFDMAYAAKLFGVFQRLHGATEFEGTGVGLALVHRIVSRHGGEVRAEGAVGAGACFTFWLPPVPERGASRLSGESRALRTS